MRVDDSMFEMKDLVESYVAFVELIVDESQDDHMYDVEDFLIIHVQSSRESFKEEEFVVIEAFAKKFYPIERVESLIKQLQELEQA